MLDKEVVPEPTAEVEVTEPENLETLLIEESPAPEPVPEPSNEVKEVPVDVEPVVATPLPTFDVPEHIVEPVVAEEETPTVDSVEGITPEVVAEETSTVDEPEGPNPKLQEVVEEPAPVVAAPAEDSEPPSEVTEQEVPVPVASEPTVEPAAEEESASDPFEADILAPEPTLSEVPPVESESASGPQEPEVVRPPVQSEEKPSTDEVELEEASLVISEPVEVSQDAPTSDVPREETKPVEGPWTPSYSVSSQGGGLDTAQPADEETVESTTAPEPLVEKLAADSIPAPEIVTPAEVCAFNV